MTSVCHPFILIGTILLPDDCSDVYHQLEYVFIMFSNYTLIHTENIKIRCISFLKLFHNKMKSILKNMYEKYITSTSGKCE